MKYVVTITGDTEDDLGYALDEAKRGILAGNVEGGDRNETGSFFYTTEED